MTPNIPFKKALYKITRKDSEAKALVAFRPLLKREIRQVRRSKGRPIDDATISRIMEENLEAWRRDDFEPGIVEYYAHLYSLQPRCGPREKS